jgi:serine/threonine protein kinase
VQEKRRLSSFGRRSSASQSDSEKFDSLEEGLSSGEGVRANHRQRVSLHGDALSLPCGEGVPLRANNCQRVSFHDDALKPVLEDEWDENNTKKIIPSDFNPGVLSGTCLTGAGSGDSATATKRRFTLTLKSVGIGNLGDDGYENLKRQFMKEMRLLSTLRHPNICTVMGEVTLGNDPMLIMEYMQMGSLFSLLHNETVPLSGELILPILQDVAKGVRFLHSSSPPVVHSDLKSANILVDSQFRAKVTDFGLSQKKKVGATGTPYWMAPELLRKESDNTTASDVYSFGIILFEAYTRKVPYDGEDYDDVIKLVADKEVQKRPPLPEKAPPQIQSIMTECFADNPNERPIFDELDVRLQRLTVESADVTDTIRSHRKVDPLSSQLFYDNFPKKVAEVLREGRKVEPESRECVSIFFSDIVGFTDISSRLSPMKVSDMLDRLYHSFDELSRAHDVFKIETIGDAYMAVTNLVKDQDDHAKRLVDFAVEALAAANETLIDVDDKSRGCVNIRVGLHSGPVVASVVGSRNLKYSIFGDTVNVAARMEQNSRVNRIHMSESTAKILRLQDPSRSITPRGTINVKGKDLPMETFWINEKSTSGEKDEYNYLPRRALANGEKSKDKEVD